MAFPPITGIDMTGACHECCGGECCDCDGTTLTFTLAGLTEGTSGFDCPIPPNCCFCEIYNREWVLAEYDQDTEDEIPCDSWREHVTGIETCAGQTTMTALAGCSGGLLTINFFAGVDPLATYSGAMHCDGPSILTWDSDSPDPDGALCTDWPETITVTYA